MTYERFVARRRRRVPHKSAVTAVGETLPTLALPLDARKGLYDVAYEGMPEMEIPQGTDRTVRDRNGNKKRYR